VIETDILIVGAGPVGLTLALDLGRRGIRTLLVERKDAPMRVPKMERSNPRTLEIYRRLGVVDQIRAAGYPADAPMDAFIVKSLADDPLLQLKYPSVNETRAAIAACTDGSLPREPYQLISQYTLEPLLFEALRSHPSVTIAMGIELSSFDQDENGVTATTRPRDGGETSTVKALYLAACDGAGSRIRQQLGIEMEGSNQLGTITNIFFRCDDLYEKSKVGAGRHYNFASVGASGGAAGAMVCQDDRKHFSYHTPSPPTSDLGEELRRLTGLDIDPEILFVSPWAQSMLVSSHHAKGRVFLAGDSNHAFIPAGGLGMNTGIGDAHNLAWKLAGAVQGWGGPHLLESYALERGAVARRNLAAVQHAVNGVVEWCSVWNPKALEDSAEGRAALAEFVRFAEPRMRLVYEMHGTELGYRYVSPIVCAEPGEPSPDDSYDYRPTTWPGAHLPHMWIEPGVAIYDRIGMGFSLLCLGSGKVDTSALEKRFWHRGASLEILKIGDPNLRRNYGYDLLLLRPDLHVVWRGHEFPAASSAIADRALGYLP
jgi:2-polyprenyl-6-methoxyphenol hydroxylase-like FAD-dependent oxidoreductase